MSELSKWFEKVDEQLLAESEVLDSLKKAVEQNFLEQEEAEERMRAYHYGTCPDIEGRDL